MAVYKQVALRKESVDRNLESNVHLDASCMSLSARRAWIEIIFTLLHLSMFLVALRKESVDRNIFPTRSRPTGASRSPQGERG